MGIFEEGAVDLSLHLQANGIEIEEAQWTEDETASAGGVSIRHEWDYRLSDEQNVQAAAAALIAEIRKDPAALSHPSNDKCDICDTKGDGTLMYARGATGRICPIMFLCASCRG